MKSNSFWVNRWLQVFGGITLILIACGMLKDHALDDVLQESVFWALLASTVFIATRYSRARRGRTCAFCRDTVE